MTLPLVHLDGLVLALLNVAAWVIGHVGGGWYAHRLSTERLGHDGPMLRLRSFEAGGRCYQRRLHIRSWKDRLPEAGAAFDGGISKRHLPNAQTGRCDALRAFARETRRGERAHLASLVVVPLCAMWNPPVGVVAMAVYGVVANAPFVLVQRYNRARIEQLLARQPHRSSVAARSGASPRTIRSRTSEFP